MLRKLTLLIAFLFTCSIAANSQYVKVLGVAEKSGSALTSGISSTNKPSITFPNAGIQIYSPTGSGVLATIYSDVSGTTKSNGFTADSAGVYDFFIQPGVTFDVRITPSGGSPSAFTRSGYTSAGTSGGVTPVCAGTNDTAVFSAAITSFGANTGSIQLPYIANSRCAVNSLTVPSNVVMDNTNGTGVKVNTGQTLTVAGPVVNPPGKQVFFNATAGLGTVSFTGNASIPVLYSEMWGSSGAALTAMTVAQATGTSTNAVTYFGPGTSIAWGFQYSATRVEITDGIYPTAPTTVAKPTVKISRAENLTTGNLADNEANAALSVEAINLPGSAQQVNAISGFAKGFGGNGVISNGDTLGVGGYGWQFDGTGAGVGGFFNGRRSVTTARAEGVEILVENLTDTAAPQYSVNVSVPLPSGAPADVNGIGLSCRSSDTSGDKRCGPAIYIGGQENTRWSAGIVFPNLSVSSYVIDDNSNATTGWHVTGTHTNLILGGADSGKVVLGNLTPGYSTKLYVESAVNGQATFASTGAFGAGINLVNLTAGQEAVVRFNEGGTGYYKLGKNGSNILILNDEVHSLTLLKAYTTSNTVELTGRLVQDEGAVLSVSGNTITPTNAIHHVGAGLIKTITVPTDFTSGSIYFVPDAAFTTDQTGNIASAGTTAVVGKIMIATWSSSTSKWYLSY